MIAGSEGEAAEGELVLHVKEIVNSGRSEEIHVEEDIVAAAGSGEAGDESNAYQSFDEAEDDQVAVVNEVNPALREESGLDEAQGFEEAGNSGQGRDMSLELGEDVGEGEVDEELGEPERGEGESEGGQAIGLHFEEVVNLMQGEGRNVDKDTAAGESVDESNIVRKDVEDAEDQAAVVEKVFYLASWVNFNKILNTQGIFTCKSLFQNCTLGILPMGFTPPWGNYRISKLSIHLVGYHICALGSCHVRHKQSND